MAFSVMATFYSLSPRRQDAKNATHRSGHKIESMASIPELLDGHVTLEVECLDRLYLNGYIGPLAISGGLVTFMREQLGKPIPSPVVLGQVTEKFREAVKTMATGSSCSPATRRSTSIITTSTLTMTTSAHCS